MTYLRQDFQVFDKTGSGTVALTGPVKEETELSIWVDPEVHGAELRPLAVIILTGGGVCLTPQPHHATIGSVECVDGSFCCDLDHAAMGLTRFDQARCWI